MLRRRGYQDWIGDVKGYGTGLEISVYAVRPNSDQGFPADRTRDAAASAHSKAGLKQRGLGQSDRISALLSFADSARS